MKYFYKIMFVLFVLACLPLHISAAAIGIDINYYLVEGRIYDDGGYKWIERIGLIEYDGIVRSGIGTDYAILATDDYGYDLYTAVIDVTFKSGSDTSAPASDYSEFAVLIPYDPQIECICLVDSNYNSLYEVYLSDSVLSGLRRFDVEETGGGFGINWEVIIEDEYYADNLNYTVIAVSQRTGEKNILAYRTAEQSLNVPYDWLDPNDGVVFVLEYNDAWTSYFADSDVYYTPDGEHKYISEEWDESGANYDDYYSYELKWHDLLEWYHWVFASVAVVAVGATVTIIIIIHRRK